MTDGGGSRLGDLIVQRGSECRPGRTVKRVDIDDPALQLEVVMRERDDGSAARLVTGVA
jgi:hypothetical protein